MKEIIQSILQNRLFLIITSVIKNKTRIIEKNIESYEKQIFTLKKELFESQLDFNYLTSPKKLQEKLSFLTSDQYRNLSISNIYLDYKNKVIKATAKEVKRNPRSRSAKLRYAIRSSDEFIEPQELRNKFKYLTDLEKRNA